MNWVEIVVTLISATLSGLVGGLFTFLGVKLTLKEQRKKDKKEEIEKKRLEAKEDREKWISQRPILNIENVYEVTDACSQLGYSDINLLLTNCGYDPDGYYKVLFANSQNFKCLDYRLKHVGYIDIQKLYISMDNKNTIYDLSLDDPKMTIRKSGTRFAARIDKVVKPNDIFTLRVYWEKDEIAKSKLKAYAWRSCAEKTLSLWLQDLKGNWWKQVLKVPKREILDSTLLEEKVEFLK